MESRVETYIPDTLVYGVSRDELPDLFQASRKREILGPGPLDRKSV